MQEENLIRFQLLEEEKKEREDDIFELVKENEKLEKSLKEREFELSRITESMQEKNLRFETELARAVDRLEGNKAEILLKDEAVQRANQKAFDERRFREELEMKVEYLINQIDTLQNELQKAKDDCLFAQEAHRTSQNLYSTLEAQLKEKRVQRSSAAIEQLEGRRNDELKRDLLKNQVLLEEERLAHKEKVKFLQQEIFGYKKLISSSSMQDEVAKRERANMELEICMVKAESDKAEQLLSETRDLNSVLKNQIHSLERRIQIFQAQLSDSEKLIEQLKQQDCGDQLQKIKQLEQEIELRDGEIEQLRQNVESLESNQQMLELKISETSNNLATKIEESISLAHQLKDRDSTLYALKLEVLFYNPLSISRCNGTM